MKKLILFIFSLFLMVIFFNYCKKQIEVTPSFPSPKVEEPKYEKEEKKKSITEEQEKIKEMTKSEETKKKQIIILDETPVKETVPSEEKSFQTLIAKLEIERNLTIEPAAINLLESSGHIPTDLISSLDTYIETSLAINPIKKSFSGEDIKNFLSLIGLFRLKPPPPIGILSIETKPLADAVSIKSLQSENRYNKTVPLTINPHKEQLLEGIYEILVYYGEEIRGKTNVKIRSYKEEKQTILNLFL